ncbi:MAG: hypothetical protein M3Y85_08235 [Bacteroidota bacterium]|nr:hypothetical protein [Bacteroidota bacterium]
MRVSFDSQLRNEYNNLFTSCVIDQNKYTDVDACVNRILANKPRYEAVATKTGVPWYFIGIVHNMEGNCNFTTHLHNGDPLTARTVQVPKGYPKEGNPPFAWEASAEDSLRLQKLDTITDWGVPTVLYELEAYNGFGYRSRGIHSPYLWSASNQYSKGKYTADGRFDPNAVSKQIGAAVLLRRMSERQIAVAGETDTITQIKALGEEIKFDPNNYNQQAEKLQTLLNSVGQPLKADGKAGQNTSDAYQRVSGHYLQGDKRRTA